MWGLLPTSIKSFYFFGNIAFKTNANNPAGIKPVVNKSLSFIPKSGMWATNSGNAFKPIPKEREYKTEEKL